MRGVTTGGTTPGKRRVIRKERGEKKENMEDGEK